MSMIRKGLSKRARMRRVSALSREPAATAVRPRKSRWWRRLLMVVCCFLGAGLLTFLLFEYLIPGKVPSALVGKWLVQGGEQAGVTLEFGRHGAFQATASVGGQVGGFKGRVEVDGEKLHIFSVNPQTGEEEAKTHVIEKLTDTELILRDQRGVSSMLTRVE
jgi:uncharacterized protein (TIGR03066 family)